MVKITFLPFRDHSATLAINFAIADIRYNIFGLPFLQTCCQSISTEHSQLILKYKLYNMATVPHIPCLQMTHKKSPFYSKVYNLTVRKHINFPGNHTRGNNIQLQKITKQLEITTLKTDIPSFQLLQKHYHQLSFTETYDPKSQAQYLNVVLENKTKDTNATQKPTLGYIHFPEEWKIRQPQPQPYTVKNLNQVTQILLYNIYWTLLMYITSMRLFSTSIILQFMITTKFRLLYIYRNPSYPKA